MIDSEQRGVIATILAVGLVFLVFVFMVSSCVNRETQLSQQTQLACMKAGGSWEYIARGSDAKTCRLNK